MTQQTGNNNIFRVHHINDIVSLIPIWPFVHVPQPGMSCCIRNHGYGPIAAHYKENYSRTLKTVKNWSDIKVPEIENVSDFRIEKWLSMDTVGVISRNTLHMIGAAIKYILKAAGVTIQLIGIGGITILDQLSFALERAIQTAKNISEWVLMLMKKIMSLLGIVINTTLNLTAEFIRWVFINLSRAIYSTVKTALISVF